MGIYRPIRCVYIRRIRCRPGSTTVCYDCAERNKPVPADEPPPRPPKPKPLQPREIHTDGCLIILLAWVLAVVSVAATIAGAFV